MITYRLAKKEDLEEVFHMAAEAFSEYEFFGNYVKDLKNDGDLFMKWKKYAY